MTTQLPPPLDTRFTPMYGVYEKLAAEAAAAQNTVCVQIACVRDGGDCDTFKMELAAPLSDTAIRFCERVVKFMMWASGGKQIHIRAPETLTRRIAADYSTQGARAFDCALMEDAYDTAPTVITEGAMPRPQAHTISLGGYLNGCRLGFDLGASDFKISAVKDGETVFADEIPWVPVTATDPDYHFNMLRDGLKKAAAHLPRVDAIGGSSAGIIVENKIKVASLIRGIAKADRPKSLNLFRRIQKEWDDIPLEVANDGDVTALAGALSLKTNAILGIAMGSSQAGGYIDRNGRLTGRLNELAFTPVDYNPDAAQDEWSKDYGVGASYFSQQAVNRLALEAGFEFPDDMPLPERLKTVQTAMTTDDPRAEKIYTTIGVYLGWTIPWYRLFYDIDTILLLGRVTSGKGGEIIVSKATETLLAIAPQIADTIRLMMPDEQSRRVGQCVAAASLPKF